MPRSYTLGLPHTPPQLWYTVNLRHSDEGTVIVAQGGLVEATVGTTVTGDGSDLLRMVHDFSDREAEPPFKTSVPLLKR